MKRIFPLIVVGVLIAAVAAWWFSDRNGLGSLDKVEQVAPEADPLDVVNSFYNEWRAARVSTTTDLYVTDFATDSRLSAALRQRLAAELDAEVDPVLCQTVVPPRTGSRLISRTDTAAEVQVLARGLPERSSEYALVSLAAVAGEWQISEILCQNAAIEATVGEFSFDKQGYLLKNVPAPLNSAFWHLVFTENNVPGHTVPLFFSELSVCVAADDTETRCDADQFTEPSQAQVQGTLTEAGVEVARIDFLP